ncbi:hypothetical protein ACI8AA_01365 [Geodermatophilus sp. SYSU D01180]
MTQFVPDTASCRTLYELVEALEEHLLAGEDWSTFPWSAWHADNANNNGGRIISWVAWRRLRRQLEADGNAAAHRNLARLLLPAALAKVPPTVMNGELRRLQELTTSYNDPDSDVDWHLIGQESADSHYTRMATAALRGPGLPSDLRSLEGGALLVLAEMVFARHLTYADLTGITQANLRSAGLPFLQLVEECIRATAPSSDLCPQVASVRLALLRATASIAAGRSGGRRGLTARDQLTQASDLLQHLRTQEQPGARKTWQLLYDRLLTLHALSSPPAADAHAKAGVDERWRRLSLCLPVLFRWAAHTGTRPVGRELGWADVPAQLLVHAITDLQAVGALRAAEGLLAVASSDATWEWLQGSGRLNDPGWVHLFRWAQWQRTRPSTPRAAGTDRPVATSAEDLYRATRRLLDLADLARLAPRSGLLPEPLGTRLWHLTEGPRHHDAEIAVEWSRGPGPDADDHAAARVPAARLTSYAAAALELVEEGHALTGLTDKQIYERAGHPRSTADRDLKVLADEGSPRCRHCWRRLGRRALAAEWPAEALVRHRAALAGLEAALMTCPTCSAGLPELPPQPLPRGFPALSGTADMCPRQLALFAAARAEAYLPHSRMSAAVEYRYAAQAAAVAVEDLPHARAYLQRARQNDPRPADDDEIEGYLDGRLTQAPAADGRGLPRTAAWRMGWLKGMTGRPDAAGHVGDLLEHLATMKPTGGWWAAALAVGGVLVTAPGGAGPQARRLTHLAEKTAALAPAHPASVAALHGLVAAAEGLEAEALQHLRTFIATGGGIRTLVNTSIPALVLAVTLEQRCGDKARAHLLARLLSTPPAIDAAADLLHADREQWSRARSQDKTPVLVPDQVAEDWLRAFAQTWVAAAEGDPGATTTLLATARHRDLMDLADRFTPTAGYRPPYGHLTWLNPGHGTRP